MKADIISPDMKSEFYTSEKCHIVELSNSPDDPEVSIARVRVEPGITTRWHLLKKPFERYYILHGQGRVEIGELPPRDVVPGSVILIPPMCRQRITNTSAEDLLFLAICSPRFTVDDYVEFDD